MSRLSDIVVGLQRMAEAARSRGQDISYSHQQEIYEHIQWLDNQLSMVEKVRTTLLEERKKFMPVENPAVGHRQDVPKIVQKGPTA